MAALLRSARLLKFSPSVLLQITGVKRNGPPLSRLYSGALGGRWTGVGSRKISPALGNAASRVWPHAVGCVTIEQKVEISMAMQAEKFEWALSKLEDSVRRTGRITKNLLLQVFHETCRTGHPSNNQALLLLRSCGSLVPEMSPAERTDLAHKVWKALQKTDTPLDVSHYNALLKVYLQNEFKFSPTDFMAKMEAANIEPNRVTYQRFIAGYCQNGDIEGAGTILGFMKNKDLAITESVFSSLVMGHVRAGDIESAENILSVMRGTDIEPGPETYVSLLNAYAEIGDHERLKKTLVTAENANISFMDRDIVQIIVSLAKAGHYQLIPEMIERLRHNRVDVPDAMSGCLNLITSGQDEVAFLILKNFPISQRSLPDTFNLGNFFLRHCVNMDLPLEKIARYCKELKELKLHSHPLNFSLLCALQAKHNDLSIGLINTLKEQNLPIRPHYFWPLLVMHAADKNKAGVIEVLKQMKELEVTIDATTLSYAYPAFSNKTEAEQAFTEEGFSFQQDVFVLSKAKSLASGRLPELYTLISDPTFPPVELREFRNSLIIGFTKSDDLETMVKITALLYNDNRFSMGKGSGAEETSYLLYNLISNMSEKELQEQQEKLQKFFSELHTQEIMITENIYRGIKNLLFGKYPQLLKVVGTLVKFGDSGIKLPECSKEIDNKVLEFEKKLAEKKEANEPIGRLLRTTMQFLCLAERLERALELKQQYEEEMTMSSYSPLIELCCKHNNLDEALNLKREIGLKNPSAVLHIRKYLALIKALSMNGRVEEALDFLKEMEKINFVLNGQHAEMFVDILDSITAEDGDSTIRKLQNTIFSLGLLKPNRNVCKPLINFYLSRDDPSRALDAAIECQKLYNVMPNFHNIFVSLMKKGDNALLQKAMEHACQARGEMNMMYNLFFSCLDAGCYSEASKIMETPGLRAKSQRLQWYAKKCIEAEQMETLEQLVHMTEKLFGCDRDEMYHYILQLCKNTNDWQKAEQMWMKMQEENVIPRDRTLLLLANILRNNGKDVPFQVSESWYQSTDPMTVTPVESERTSIPTSDNLIDLIKGKKIQKAFEELMSSDSSDVIDHSTYNSLIDALLQEGSIENAIEVKNLAASRLQDFHLNQSAAVRLIILQSKKGQTKDALESLKSMLLVGQKPAKIAISKLLQALARQGNVAVIQEVDSIVKHCDLPRMMFINSTALAHIKNGDLETAVDILETHLTEPANKKSNISYVFKEVLESGDEKTLDRLTVMADQLANKFSCHKPITDLFLELLSADKYEEAKLMLDRYDVLTEQKSRLFNYMFQMLTEHRQAGRVKTMLSLFPDLIEKEQMYSLLMKCHEIDNDLPSAKAMCERMQEEGVHVNNVDLKRLAKLYKNAGEKVPFPEPPESFTYYIQQITAKNQRSAQK